jgi:ethanolamine ammonia-lyase small subunit
MSESIKITADSATSVVANPWRMLQRFTSARIGLGRAGISLPTKPQLDFQLAHAQARDAVHCALDVPTLCRDLDSLGLQTVPLRSAATTRSTYLQRPDRGRQLSNESRQQLEALLAQRSATRAPPYDLAFAVVDGLSALAVQRHAAPLLSVVLAGLAQREKWSPVRWSIAPVAVVEQGRVAIGDEIGELFDSRMIVVLIGERPGLSSPDSLGLYLTWDPRPGRSDAERNCISNVRPEGQPYADAAARLIYLLEQARTRQLSGVALKDESETGEAIITAHPNFLLGES